jgi:uncharacterized protein (DUF1684 family)
MVSCKTNKATLENYVPPTHKAIVDKARAEQLESRITDKAVKNTSELSYFDINSKLRIEANFTKNADPASFDINTSNGSKKQFYTYGHADFYLDGVKNRLAIYRNVQNMRHPKYKNYLFLPFTDDTSGEETYGGGRYIDVHIDDLENNMLVIDFNTAYNPYCAYGDGWSCPIPPAENYIAVKILAGEKYFKGEKQNRQ